MTDKLSLLLDSFIDRQKENIKNDLARLVAIPSIVSEAEGKYVYGSRCAQAIDEMTAIGLSYGFKAENCDYHCLTLTYEQPGCDGKEVGIICHLDVVPAGEGWEHEPFSLTESNGLYIGRGTRDDKGGAITGLYAMKFLKEQEINLPFPVKLILGSDEEVAMTDLPYYLSKHKPPFFSFTPDSEYPVCIGEKGIAGVEITLCCVGDVLRDINGGHADNAVCDCVKAVICYDGDINADDDTAVEKCADGLFRLSSHGLTSHAAYPEGSANAIYNLAHYVNRNALFPETCAEHRAFRFLEDALGTYKGEGFGIECSDKESGYLTCIAGKIFIRDKKLILNINIRYPVTLGFSDIMSRLQDKCREYGAKATLLYDKKPYYFDPSDINIMALTDAYSAVTGECNTTYTTGGGTYARAFPNTVAFGNSMADSSGLLGEHRGGAHDRDEYISVREIHDGIRIIVRAILNLSKFN